MHLWPWLGTAGSLLILYVAIAPVVMYIMMECPDPYGTWASNAWNIYRPLWFIMDHCPALSHLVSIHGPLAMTDRKKPGVAFWATVLVIVLLVGYLLSIRPATWIIGVLPKSSIRMPAQRLDLAGVP